MPKEIFTEEMRQQLKDKGYAAVVLQVVPQFGRVANEIASRHRSVYAAHKRADVNQRVVTL
jgi:ABC-type sugar transport system substrate-binding protein